MGNTGDFAQIIDQFTVCKKDLEQIAAAFRRDIEEGLIDAGLSSLRMLKSYVGLPTGDETGEFLALDFGGTNVRVLLIQLLGRGRYDIVRKVIRPLCVPGSYDVVGPGAQAADLFNFIADLIAEVLAGESEKLYRLGHTFSFPSEQTDLCDARLILWTKELAVRGVEGQAVNDLLAAALVRRGLCNVRPVALINDTVATLLAASYQTAHTYIGSICGTGYNMAYLEPYRGAARPRMILNLESGGFNKLMNNSYDRALDAASDKPGEQRLEKMVSGRYLGTLFGMALADGLGCDAGRFAFSSLDLSMMLDDNTTDLTVVRTLMERKTGIIFAVETCAWVKAVAECIVIRSARLVAATYIGMLWHLEDEGIPSSNIAMDGSLYEKMPLYAASLRQAMDEVLGTVRIILIRDGSGAGAAIAAAL